MKIPWKKLPPLVLVCLGATIYANSLTCPFIFDDVVAVTGNASVKSILPIVPTARFVTDLTFRLNYAIGGFNVADYHLVNILVHILAGLALYGLVRRTLKLESMSARWRRHSEWVALLAAALWVAHPLQTQSVTYICQRYESMMGLFFLFAMYCFVRAAGSSRPRAWSDASIAACLVGMGTKQVIVTAPLMILLYDWTFLDRISRGSLRSRWKVHAALFLTIGVSVLLDLRMVGASLVAGSETVAPVPPLTYLLTQGGVILHYLRLSIAPWPLCLDYAWPLVSDWREAALPVLAVGALGAASAWGVIRRSAVGYLGVFFFIVLAPTSSVMPLADPAFEHRMYLPLVAVVVLVAGGVHRGAVRLSKALVSRRVAWWCEGVLAVVLVMLLGSLTVLRNRDYQSSEAMWRATTRVRPHNYRQFVAFISALVSNQQWSEAERTARRLLAVTAAAQSEARTGPVIAASDARRYHAVALGQLGRILLARGKVDESISVLEQAIREEPENKVMYLNLGGALFMANRHDEALVATQRSIRVEPTYAKAHAQLGFILASMGKCRQAAPRYRFAVKRAPHLVVPKVELAWLLATCPDNRVRRGSEAVLLARSALASTRHRSVAATDALAAAFAEIGQTEDAVAFAEQALRLLAEDVAAGGRAADVSRAAAWDCTADSIRDRIELYQAGSAFRQMPVAAAGPVAADEAAP